MSGSLSNLSQGGCLLKSRQTYEEGQMIEMDIETTSDNGAREHKLMAVVVWTNEKKIGLEFLSGRR